MDLSNIYFILSSGRSMYGGGHIYKAINDDDDSVMNDHVWDHPPASGAQEPPAESPLTRR